MLLAVIIPGARLATAQPLAGPAPTDAMAAWHTVQGWLHEWGAPDDATSIDPPGITGACVTIRLDNLVLARAQEFSEDGLALYRAAREAIAQARARAPVQRADDVDDRLRMLVPSLALDVQFAGALIPLLGDSFDEAALTVGPGLDGVAARAGDRLRGHFPATMLAQNATPSSALVVVAADALSEAVNLPGRDVKALREHRSLVLYRFPTLHLAQIAPSREPEFLTRGARVIPPTDITRSSLVEFALHLAQNLSSRVDEQGRLSGPYEPWSDSVSTPLASLAEQGLTAFALARHAASPTTNAANALLSARAAWSLIDGMGGVENWEIDPTGAAGFLIALEAARPRPTFIDPARAPADEVKWGAIKSISNSFLNGAWQGELSPAARALITFASARVTNHNAELLTPEKAEAMLRSLLVETPPAQLVSLTPWLVWAELSLAPADASIPSTTALQEMRALVWKHQVSLSDTATIAPDLLGGIVFTSGPTPLPTWQTARPLPALASMLADARLTSAEDRPSEFAKLLLSLRFLRQLSADDRVVHLFRNPARARWGVREALWNHRQPADATALALLSVLETLRATQPQAPRKP